MQHTNRESHPNTKPYNNNNTSNSSGNNNTTAGGSISNHNNSLNIISFNQNHHQIAPPSQQQQQQQHLHQNYLTSSHLTSQGANPNKNMSDIDTLGPFPNHASASLMTSSHLQQLHQNNNNQQLLQQQQPPPILQQQHHHHQQQLGNSNSSNSASGSYNLSSSLNQFAFLNQSSTNMNINQMINQHHHHQQGQQQQQQQQQSSYGMDDVGSNQLSVSYDNIFSNLFDPSKSSEFVSVLSGSTGVNSHPSSTSTSTTSTTSTTTNNNTTAIPDTSSTLNNVNNPLLMVTPSSEISSPSPPPPNSSVITLASSSSPNQQSPLPSPATSSSPISTDFNHHGGGGVIPTYSNIINLTSNNNNNNNSSNKKLKRGYDQMFPKDEWEPYLPPGKIYNLLTLKSDLTGTFGFKIKRTDKNIQFSELDSAWILYRQNRFQIDCDLTGSLESWSNTDRSNPLFVSHMGTMTEVTGLYFTLYVLRFSNTNQLLSQNELTDRVPIHQLGTSSGKKDGRLPVEPCPIIKGKANWTKLQFGSATGNNARVNPDQPNPNQQFFRIVVLLNAVVDRTATSSTTSSLSTPPSTNSMFFPIQAKVSPPMIVRGQNPGRFLNHDKSSKKDSNSSPQQSMSPNISPQPNNPFQKQQQQQQHDNFVQPFPHPINHLNSNNNSANTTPGSTSLNPLKLSTSSMSSSSSSSTSSSINESEPLNTTWLNSLKSPTQHSSNQQQQQSNQQDNNNYFPQQQQQSNNGYDQPFQFLSNQQQQQNQQETTSTTSTNYITLQNSHIQSLGNPFQQQQPLQMISIQEPVPLRMNDQTPWTRNPLSEDMIYTTGKVGINTSSPTQALSVNGNILVTGDLFKPSDRRIKSNIQRDSSNHWDKIDRLKLYNYDRKKMQGYDQPSLNANQPNTVKEKGFIAQELREVIPNAVSVAGEVRLQDGSNIQNLLVVNDRVLLVENIGATQQIGRTLRREHDHIVEMDKELNRVKIEGKRDQHVVLNKMQDLVSFMLSEEQTKQVQDHGDSCVYCSLMGLGPAWTMFVFGFFFPFFWVVGSFFLFSPSRVKWISGLVNFITTLVFLIVTVLLAFYEPQLSYVILVPSLLIMGIVLCVVVGFFRQRTWESKKKFYRERMKLMQKDGYRNLNEHIDQMRTQFSTAESSRKASSKQSIDITPISEMYSNNVDGGGNNSLHNSSSSITSSSSSAFFTPDIDNFKTISLNNHKALQEIPLSKLVMDYGKKNNTKKKRPTNGKSRTSTFTTSTTTTTTTTSSSDPELPTVIEV